MSLPSIHSLIKQSNILYWIPAFAGMLCVLKAFLKISLDLSGIQIRSILRGTQDDLLNLGVNAGVH